jgi:hypothetical protein
LRTTRFIGLPASTLEDGDTFATLRTTGEAFRLSSAELDTESNPIAGLSFSVKSDIFFCLRTTGFTSGLPASSLEADDALSTLRTTGEASAERFRIGFSESNPTTGFSFSVRSRAFRVRTTGCTCLPVSSPEDDCTLGTLRTTEGFIFSSPEAEIDTESVPITGGANSRHMTRNLAIKAIAMLTT